MGKLGRYWPVAVLGLLMLVGYFSNVLVGDMISAPLNALVLRAWLFAIQEPKSIVLIIGLWLMASTALVIFHLGKSKNKEGDNNEGQEFPIFDMTATEVVNYVGGQLGLTPLQATRFIVEGIKGKKKWLQLWAERERTGQREFVEPELFDVAILHLVCDDNQKRGLKAAGLYYHPDGWIEPTRNSPLFGIGRLIAPRFSRKEMESYVSWYKRSLSTNG